MNTLDITKIANSFFNLDLSGGVLHQFDSGVGNGIGINGDFRTNNASPAIKSLLRSSSPGVQWELSLQGISSLNDTVSVQDSDARGGFLVEAEGSQDVGNNLNWSFGAEDLLEVIDVIEITSNLRHFLKRRRTLGVFTG